MDQLVLPPAMIETLTLAGDWVIVLPLALALLGAALLLMLRRTPTLSFMFALLIVLGIIACEASLLLRVADAVRPPNRPSGAGAPGSASAASASKRSCAMRTARRCS